MSAVLDARAKEVLNYLDRTIDAVEQLSEADRESFFDALQSEYDGSEGFAEFFDREAPSQFKHWQQNITAALVENHEAYTELLDGAKSLETSDLVEVLRDAAYLLKGYESAYQDGELSEKLDDLLGGRKDYKKAEASPGLVRSVTAGIQRFTDQWAAIAAISGGRPGRIQAADPVEPAQFQVVESGRDFAADGPTREREVKIVLAESQRTMSQFISTKPGADQARHITDQHSDQYYWDTLMGSFENSPPMDNTNKKPHQARMLLLQQLSQYLKHLKEETQSEIEASKRRRVRNTLEGRYRRSELTTRERAERAFAPTEGQHQELVRQRQALIQAIDFWLPILADARRGRIRFLLEQRTAFMDLLHFASSFSLQESGSFNFLDMELKNALISLDNRPNVAVESLPYKASVRAAAAYTRTQRFQLWEAAHDHLSWQDKDATLKRLRAAEIRISTSQWDKLMRLLGQAAQGHERPLFMGEFTLEHIADMLDHSGFFENGLHQTERTLLQEMGAIPENAGIRRKDHPASPRYLKPEEVKVKQEALTKIHRMLEDPKNRNKIRGTSIVNSSESSRVPINYDEILVQSEFAKLAGVLKGAKEKSFRQVDGEHVLSLDFLVQLYSLAKARKGVRVPRDLPVEVSRVELNNLIEAVDSAVGNLQEAEAERLVAARQNLVQALQIEDPLVLVQLAKLEQLYRYREQHFIRLTLFDSSHLLANVGQVIVATETQQRFGDVDGQDLKYLKTLKDLHAKVKEQHRSGVTYISIAEAAVTIKALAELERTSDRLKQMTIRGMRERLTQQMTERGYQETTATSLKRVVKAPQAQSVSLKERGLPVFRHSLDRSITSTGSLRVDSFVREIYMLTLRKLGIDPSIHSGYVGSFYHSHSGFREGILSFLETGEFPDSFWQNIKEELPSDGFDDKDAFLEALKENVYEAVVETRGSVYYESNPANRAAAVDNFKRGVSEAARNYRGDRAETQGREQALAVGAEEREEDKRKARERTVRRRGRR